VPLDILLPSIEEDMFLRRLVDRVVTISTAVALVDLSLFVPSVPKLRKISRPVGQLCSRTCIRRESSNLKSLSW